MFASVSLSHFRHYVPWYHTVILISIILADQQIWTWFHMFIGHVDICMSLQAFSSFSIGVFSFLLMCKIYLNLYVFIKCVHILSHPMDWVFILDIFWWTEVLNVNVVQLISLFMLNAFCVPFKKALTSSWSWRRSFTFSSKIFIILLFHIYIWNPFEIDHFCVCVHFHQFLNMFSTSHWRDSIYLFFVYWGQGPYQVGVVGLKGVERMWSVLMRRMWQV